jgi:hypothetical protein
LFKLDVGVPDVVTVNDPGVPAVNVVLAALVMLGGVPVTVSECVVSPLAVKFPPTSVYSASIV